jgi:hypothetical protein
MEWTDEAIIVAIDALPSRRLDADEVKAILDAAVKEQGLDRLLSMKEYAEMCHAAGAQIDKHYDYGRNDALEEAAKALEVKTRDISGVVAAEIVRALKTV